MVRFSVSHGGSCGRNPYRTTAVSISLPERAEGVRSRSVPHDKTEKESVYPGADRSWKDDFHCFSGGESGGRKSWRIVIFYLTAKTITGTVAREAFELLRKGGYQAKIIQITAKEKLCMCDEMECNPVHCPYAKGHYDRVNDAVFQLLLQEDVFSREVLLEQAEKYQVCPFEMSLDVASWVDDIICDYNYVFDPNVYLKRFFAEGIRGDYIFLVDEAHNLVERSREMYSAEIYKEDFLAVKKIVKRYRPGLEQQFNHCNRISAGI